jgi:hypothetical protein
LIDKFINRQAFPAKTPPKAAPDIAFDLSWLTALLLRLL